MAELCRLEEINKTRVSYKIDLKLISTKHLNEIERKIKIIGIDAENNTYMKQLRRMYWILISISTLFTLLSIPVLFFTIEYLNFMR